MKTHVMLTPLFGRIEGGQMSDFVVGGVGNDMIAGGESQSAQGGGLNWCDSGNGGDKLAGANEISYLEAA